MRNHQLVLPRRKLAKPEPTCRIGGGTLRRLVHTCGCGNKVDGRLAHRSPAHGAHDQAAERALPSVQIAALRRRILRRNSLLTHSHAACHRKRNSEKTIAQNAVRGRHSSSQRSRFGETL